MDSAQPHSTVCARSRSKRTEVLSAMDAQRGFLELEAAGSPGRYDVSYRRRKGTQ